MVKFGLAWRFETQVVCLDHKEKHQVDVLMGRWGRDGEVLESFFFSFVCFRDRVSVSCSSGCPETHCVDQSRQALNTPSVGV